LPGIGLLDIRTDITFDEAATSPDASRQSLVTFRDYFVTLLCHSVHGSSVRLSHFSLESKGRGKR